MKSFSIDGLGLTARMALNIWIGRPEAMETYRSAVLDIKKLHFWIAEPTGGDLD